MSLRSVLNHSLLLGPVTRLAGLSASTLAQWWWNSWLGRSFAPLFRGERAGPETEPRSGSRQTVLTVGVALLFFLSTFLETTPIGLLTWGLLGIALVGGGIGRRPLFRSWTVLDAAVLLFFLSCAVSAAFSTYRAESLLGFSKMMTFLAGYLVFRSVNDQRSSVTVSLLWLLVFLGAVESAVGFYQVLNYPEPLATWQDPEINPELQMNRIYGTLQPNNPNLLAGFLLPCLAAAIGLGFYPIFKSSRGRWRTMFSLLPALILGGTLLIALGLTGSRGGYLAVGAMLLVAFLMVGHLLFHQPGLREKRRWKILWIGVLGVCVGGILLGVAGSEKLQHRLTSILAMREDSSIAFRLNVYGSAWRMFLDNWLVGIGPGNDVFKQVYGLYMVPGYTALGAYSVPLEIAIEQGVIGLALFLFLVKIAALRTLFLLDGERPLKDKILAGTLFVGIVGSLVYGFFDTIWYRPAVNLPFWFLVAALSGLTEDPASYQSHRESLAEG